MALRRSTGFLTNLRRCAVAPPSSTSISLLARSITTQTLPNTQTQARYFYSNTCPYILEPPKLKGVRKNWTWMEDEYYLYMRIDMPGLSQDEVHYFIEKRNHKTDPTMVGNATHMLYLQADKQNELGEKESEDAEEVGTRMYKLKSENSPLLLKTDEISWAVKDGVFRKIIPRVEKRDVSNGYVTWNFDRLAGIENPFLFGTRRPWFAKEEEGKGFTLRIDMPGLVGDDVKVFHESGNENVVVIEGEGKEESKYEWFVKRRIRCKLDVDKFSKTVKNIEMENGVFVINIPPK